MYHVMTFNIRMGRANDGRHSWEQRCGAAVEMIRRHRPDLLGVQEAFDFQVDYLREMLPGYQAVGVGREDGLRQGEHALVLVRAAALEVVQAGWYWLSPTPETPSKGWGAHFERIVTSAELRDRGNGRSFLFLNTHWDHESERARQESAKLMGRRLEDRPAIVVGDFNCTSAEVAYRDLLGTGPRALEDAYRAADRERGTYHGFTGEPQLGRIDWILHTREFRPRNARTDRAQFNGLWPSDHFPVIADLEWGAE